MCCNAEDRDGPAFADEPPPIDDVGRVAAFLASDAGSSLTGSGVYADRGFHMIAQAVASQQNTTTRRKSDSFLSLS